MALLESSDPLVFKKVRVCIKKESCLLVAHLSLDNVFKTTVKSKKGRIFVERVTDNGTPSREVLSNDHQVLEPIACELVTLLEDKVIESFEWEHKPLTIREAQETARKLKSLLKGIQFRVKKLVFNHTIPKEFEQEIMQLFDNKYLRAIDKRSIAHDDAVSADPLYVLDFFYPNYLNGITMRFSRIFLKWDNFDDFNFLIPKLMSEKSGVFLIFRAPYEHPQEMFDQRVGTIQKLPNKFVKRELLGPLILRHNLSSCGYWVTVVRKSDESIYNWSTESKCGLGEFCPNCTGPFEYIYFYDMPRRVIEEPEWLNVFRNVWFKYEEEIYFSRLSKLVKKTTPMRVRRAVEGFEAPKVDMYGDPSSPPFSKKRTFFIWTLITTLITAVFYYFFPDLLNPYLLSIPVLLIPQIHIWVPVRSLFGMSLIGESLWPTVLFRLFYSALLSMSFLYFFPDLLNPKLVMFLAFLIPWWRFLTMFVLFVFVVLRVYLGFR